jgi:hypothetical protein
MTRLEKEHVRSMGVRTKTDLEILFEHQRSFRDNQKTSGPNSEPCFICKTLAMKMGYEIRSEKKKNPVKDLLDNIDDGIDLSEGD